MRRVDFYIKNQLWIFNIELKTVTLYDGIEINQCSFKQFETLLETHNEIS